jgi:hypothetical protein
MEEAGEEEKGWVTPSLGTSSKLLEPGAGHPSSLAVTAFWERGGGWRLTEAKKP